MSDRDPAVKMQPANPLTHSEVIFDFVDMEPGEDFDVKITGPIAQDWLGSLRADDLGSAQLIWRTQAAGDYELSSEEAGTDFTVSYQAGEEDLIARGIMAEGGEADVKTVKPTQNKPAESKPAPEKPAPKQTTAAATKAKAK